MRVKKKKKKPAKNDGRRTKQDKKEEKDKKKKLLIAGCWEKENIFQNTLPHFLSILERLIFGGFARKIVGPYQFSLLLPLLTKNHFHSFSLIFFTLFFLFSPKSSQSNIPLIYSENILRSGEIGGKEQEHFEEDEHWLSGLIEKAIIEPVKKFFDGMLNRSLT